MPDFEAIEVLTQAKERLFECGWGRHNAHHRPDGSMCLEEAILGERGRFVKMTWGDSKARAGRYILEAVAPDRNWPFQFNDAQTSAAPVFAALDEAILLAKEAPTPETEN